MRDLFYNNKLFNVTVILFKSIQKSFRNGAVIFHRSEEMRFPLSLQNLIIQHLRNLDSVFTFLEQLGREKEFFTEGSLTLLGVPWSQDQGFQTWCRYLVLFFVLEVS